MACTDSINCPPPPLFVFCNYNGVALPSSLPESSTLPVATAAAALGVDSKAGDTTVTGRPIAPQSAEVDSAGRPYLASAQWHRMGGGGEVERPGLLDRVFVGLYGNLAMEDRLRAAWLAGTLFFIIGG